MMMSDDTEWLGEEGPRTPPPLTDDLTYMDVAEDPLGARLDLGDVVAGKYQLKSLLGKGGFGSVYRAHHTDLGHDVAIKVLNPAIAQNAEAQQRFLKEVQSQTAFVHKHAVQVRDFGRDKDQGCLYFTMDLVEGRTLAELFSQGPLDPQRVVRLGCQALDALAEAHKASLVHRDLKPANLIVTDGPDGEEVRILDFGIAKAVSSASADSGGLTRTGTTLGTLHYMSPEQADGARLDARSDIYSLGVVLFEALSGRRPTEPSPEAENASQSFLTNLMTRPPVALSELAPELPAPLCAAVMTALAKLPADRHSDALAFRSALSAACSSEDGVAPAAAFRVEQDPFAGRKLVLIALVLLLVGVVGWQVFNLATPKSAGEGSAVESGQPMTYQDFAAALERLLERPNPSAKLQITETFTGRSVEFMGHRGSGLVLRIEGLKPFEADSLHGLFSAPGKTHTTGARTPPSSSFERSFGRDPERAAKAVVGIYQRVYKTPPGARFTLLEN